MKKFDQYIQYRVLSAKYDNSDKLLDMILEDPEEMKKVENAVPIKNVCAKMPVPFVEKLESVCSFLGMSKRLFIELSLAETIDRAEQSISDIYLDDEIQKWEEKTGKGGVA